MPREIDCQCRDEYKDDIEKQIHLGQIFRYGEYIDCSICEGTGKIQICRCND